MSNLKKLIYTLLLAVTCIFASPFIYKQIWKNSDLKRAKAAKKEPVVSTVSDPAAGQQATAATDNSQPTSEGETAPAATDAAEAPDAPQSSFVQSGPEYFDDALFIGDSRTVGIMQRGTLKNADYFCDIGLSAYKIDTTNVDGKTVWGKLNAKQYGKIYVMLGINEVGNDIEYTTAAYRKLIDGIRQVQPDATIYVEANLHVASYAETSIINNDRINMLNGKLSEIADSGNNIYYLDVNGVFDDENGALTADYTEDGIHVFAKYYPTWCEWLCANTVSTGGAAPAAPAETAAPAAQEAPAATEPTTESRPQNEEFSNR